MFLPTLSSMPFFPLDVIIDLKDGNRIVCYGYNTQEDKVCASLNSKKLDRVATTGFSYYEVKF